MHSFLASKMFDYKSTSLLHRLFPVTCICALDMEGSAILTLPARAAFPPSLPSRVIPSHVLLCYLHIQSSLQLSQLDFHS